MYKEPHEMTIEQLVGDDLVSKTNNYTTKFIPAILTRTELNIIRHLRSKGYGRICTEEEVEKEAEWWGGNRQTALEVARRLLGVMSREEMCKIPKADDAAALIIQKIMRETVR